MSGQRSPTKSAVHADSPVNDSGAKYLSQRCDPRTNSSALSATPAPVHATHTEQICEPRKGQYPMSWCHGVGDSVPGSLTSRWSK